MSMARPEQKSPPSDGGGESHRRNRLLVPPPPPPPPPVAPQVTEHGVKSAHADQPPLVVHLSSVHISGMLIIHLSSSNFMVERKAPKLHCMCAIHITSIHVIITNTIQCLALHRVSDSRVLGCGSLHAPARHFFRVSFPRVHHKVWPLSVKNESNLILPMLQSLVPEMWLSTGTAVKCLAFKKHCSAPSQVQNLENVFYLANPEEKRRNCNVKLTCKLPVGGKSRRTDPRTLPSECCRRTRRSKSCAHSSILQKETSL